MQKGGDVLVCFAQHKPDPQLSYFYERIWKGERWSLQCLRITEELVIVSNSLPLLFYTLEENKENNCDIQITYLQKCLKHTAALKYLKQNS